MPTGRGRWPTATLVLALVLVAPWGCGGDAPAAADGGLDGGGADAGADAAGPAIIEVYVAGDSTPRTFSDGLSGQTPRDYHVGLQRFDLMRSATDDAPVVVFDRTPAYSELDLGTLSLAGVGRTGDIPAGAYTHGRAALAMARLTVDATAHAAVLGATGVAGEMTVIDALASVAIDGNAYAKGQCTLAFAAGTFSDSWSGAMPPLPSTTVGTLVDDGTRVWLVFAFPEPVVVDPASPATHRATIFFETYQSFRWEEKALAGYATGAWDVNADVVSSELVRGFGAAGYRVELE